jgi:hypothetical protein
MYEGFCELENYVVFWLQVFVDSKLYVVLLEGFVDWKTM